MSLEVPIDEWDVATVHTFLCSLKMPNYESMLHYHGVDGSALVHFDNDALKDIGIHSVVRYCWLVPILV
jgi:hypothetical protein